VAIALLSFIVLGLFAMFNQTQRAFRLGMNQADILEDGRAVMDMIPRELEQIAPSDRNTVNFSVGMAPNVLNASLLAPLTQSLPGTTNNYPMRTNLLEDCFFLLRQNQTWVGIGYCVRTNDPTTGRLWLPQVSGATNGAGSLYRFAATLPALISDPGYPDNGLPQNPVSLFIAFTNACASGSLASQAISNRICDGVVHFRLRAFATNGFPLFWDGVHANASFLTNSLTLGSSQVKMTLAAPNIYYPSPDNWANLYFVSNAVPAAVELELGLLEPDAWNRYNSIANPTARLAYLQRDDTASRVHLFRQRVPIRNVDPSAYQ
jgi:hypothetical protein